MLLKNCHWDCYIERPLYPMTQFCLVTTPREQAVRDRVSEGIGGGGIGLQELFRIWRGQKLSRLQGKEKDENALWDGFCLDLVRL